MTRFPRWAIYGAIALVVLVSLFLAFSRGNRQAADQAKQATASGEAIANAADMAVDTITNRTVTEQDIDRATSIAQMEINNAADPDAVRSAVIAGVCGQAEHRGDPACGL